MLAAWDRTYTLNSRGSLLFQKFWDNIGLLNLGGGAVPTPWRDALDPADPVNTPNQLATDRPDVWLAFGNAVAELRAAGIAPDAPLSEHQTVTRTANASRCTDRGTASACSTCTGAPAIQEVHFPTDGPPRTATLTTSSQSTDPTSPHFADQTRLFSAGTWVTERFTEQQIAASPQLTIVVLD